MCLTTPSLHSFSIQPSPIGLLPPYENLLASLMTFSFSKFLQSIFLSILTYFLTISSLYKSYSLYFSLNKMFRMGLVHARDNGRPSRNRVSPLPKGIYSGDYSTSGMRQVSRAVSTPHGNTWWPLGRIPGN